MMIYKIIRFGTTCGIYSFCRDLNLVFRLFDYQHFHEIAYKANDRKDLLKGIHEFLDESIVLPPGEWDGELFPFEGNP